MPEPGWFADPSGRFTQRWFDGTAWTDDVVAADGRAVRDALPSVERPPQAYVGTPFQGVPSGSATTTSAPGIGLAAAGLLLVVLSLFVLAWTDRDKSRFTDLSSDARKAGAEHVPDSIYIYAAWLGFVLFAVVVLLVLVAGIVSAPALRIGAALVAGLAAVLQTQTIAKIFSGPGSPHAGAWLGILGYFVVIAAMALGPRRPRPPAA